MKKRESFAKEGSKSKPFTVRFTQDFLNDIKERRQITNGQKIVTFLEYLYNQTFNPVVGNPVMERNSPLHVDLHGQGEVLSVATTKGYFRPPEAPKKAKDVQSAGNVREKSDNPPQNDPQGLPEVSDYIKRRQNAKNGIK